MFWKPTLLPSSGKEAPNLVDSLLFPDTGYNRMGKVKKGDFICRQKYVNIDPCVALINSL